MAEGFRKKAEALRRLAKDILDTELTPAQKAAAEAAEQEGAEAEIVPPVVDTPHDMPTGTAPIDRAHDENEARRAAQADLAEATRAAAALEPIAPPTAAPEPVVEDEKTERNTRADTEQARRQQRHIEAAGGFGVEFEDFIDGDFEIFLVDVELAAE
jgi:dethiobiotin synthetase